MSPLSTDCVNASSVNILKNFFFTNISLGYTYMNNRCNLEKPMASLFTCNMVFDLFLKDNLPTGSIINTAVIVN